MTLNGCTDGVGNSSLCDIQSPAPISFYSDPVFFPSNCIVLKIGQSFAFALDSMSSPACTLRGGVTGTPWAETGRSNATEATLSGYAVSSTEGVNILIGIDDGSPEALP